MPKTKPTIARRNGRTPTPKGDNRLDLAAVLLAKADEADAAKTGHTPAQSPAVESHPIPAIARSAAAMVLQRFQQEINILAQQTIAAMDLPADDAWHVDFDAGTVSRPVSRPAQRQG